MSKKHKNLTDTKKSSIWGGRFSSGTAEIMQKINASISYDRRLYKQDIAGSKAHAKMLAKSKIITNAEYEAIESGLDRIAIEIESGDFIFKEELEDIHMNIESRLFEIIGEPAHRLHTARSRNDQVATDLKLWVRELLDSVDSSLAELQTVFLEKAEIYSDLMMPGLTHLQTAQPITLGFHLLAYVEMLGRDRGRFSDARLRLNESPLGSAALAGTSFSIDRHLTAKELDFDRPTSNAMDSVSDRDFALEFLSAAAICSVHLSRFSEELILWSSDRFSFISLSDAFTSGSSIMPQKRNPDAAELVRAKPGRIIGALNGLLIVMKGLPLAYGKDMQEDKEGVFDAADALCIAISVTTEMLRDMTPNPKAMLAALETGFPTATDLADYLVRELGIPFREAHHICGALVAKAVAEEVDISELSLEKMQAIEPRILENISQILSISASTASRNSFGGTAPNEVRERIADARRRFKIE